MSEPSSGRVIRGWDDYSEKERQLILDHIMPDHLAAMGSKNDDPAAAQRRHKDPLYKDLFNRVHAGFSTDTDEVAGWPTEEQLDGPVDEERVKVGVWKSDIPEPSYF
jgi:hypothetical protein